MAVAVVGAGSFLLFVVQPVAAKLLLPGFGGAAAVWTSCMLFFQAALLAGYTYAYLSTALLTPRSQLRLHGVLLACAVAAIAGSAGDGWRSPEAAAPVVRILIDLVCLVGAPFFVISSTGPLFQTWYARAAGGRSPYGLYAVSNAISLIGLIVYPFVVEPNSGVVVQLRCWYAASVVFAAVCATTGYLLLRAAPIGGSPVAQGPRSPRPPSESPSPGTFLRWLLLPACASLLLLAVTAELCQNVASLPLLWVLPLAVYLLAFAVPFAGARWYPRRALLALSVPSLAVLALTTPYYLTVIGLEAGKGLFMWRTVLITCAFGVLCFVCLGALYRARPNPSLLGRYYLAISAGGVLGALVAAVVPPLRLFVHQELQIALLGSSLIAVFAAIDQAADRRQVRWRGAVVVAALALMGLLVAAFVRQTTALRSGALAASRSFYGAITVLDVQPRDRVANRHKLMHGSTCHGVQYRSSVLCRIPTAYYAPRTGVGLLLAQGPDPVATGRRIGVVGLGAGTLAAYGRAGDTIRFFEIDPAIESVARDTALFTFLRDSPADVEVVMGDGRLGLERERSRREFRPYDVLVLDAFSSDAIPVHLLTREAFSLYLSLIGRSGVAAFHVTNRTLDLAPMVAGMAAVEGCACVVHHVDPLPSIDEPGADWVLVGRNDLALRAFPGALPPRAVSPAASLWTDDRSSLLQVLRKEAVERPASRMTAQ